MRWSIVRIVRIVGVAGIVGVALCGLVATAHADRADQLFKKGKRLLAEKKYSEACDLLVESDKVDPGIGTKVNVARCYEEWGKLATAWRWYTDAEHMAASGHDDRAKKIHALIAELDPNVPRLTVSLPPDTATDHVIEVKLDGVDLPATGLGVERRVDPGLHIVDTIVDGASRTKRVPIERGGSTEITLDVPLRATSRARPSVTEVDAAPDPRRRLIGLGVSGAGVVALGVAGIVTLRARGDYHHALSAHCSGMTDMCDEIGQAAARSARRRANISTGVTIGGALAVAGGLFLYFTARTPAPASRDEHALYVAPVVGDGTGVVLGGAF